MAPGSRFVPSYSYTHEIRFLGTSSGCGVPSSFCHCSACEEAREHPEHIRNCSVAIVAGGCNLLIDTSPDLRIDLVREGIGQIVCLAYTYARSDCFASQGELEYYVRLHTGTRIPLYVGWCGHDEITLANGYMLECLDRHLVKPCESFECDDVHCLAISATHTPGTPGWHMTFPSGATLMYMCDTGTLSSEVAEAVRGRIDAIAWNATCRGTSLASGTHHSSQQVFGEAIGFGSSQIYLMHFAPNYADAPAYHADTEVFAAQYGGRVHVAYDGLRLFFCRDTEEGGFMVA